MSRVARIGIACAAAWTAACTDVGSYTTDMGECYSGKIVDASFVRRGFGQGVSMTLTVDVNALARGARDAGRVTTGDGRFRGASVSQMMPLVHDTLSLFQFPGGRVRNYLAHARPESGPPALAVISLMEDGSVEVRIVRPEGESAEGEEALFGVFRLTLDEECEARGGG